MAQFRIPSGWPNWNKVCGAKRRGKEETCKLKAVVGCPRCRFHGSGGEKNRFLGELRYMAWVILGGPQEVPVEQFVTLALAVYAERLLKQGKGTEEQQYKAALWLTQYLD